MFLSDATFWTAVGSVATAAAFIYMIKQNKSVEQQTMAALKQTELAQKTYTYTSGWQEKEKAAELSRFYQEQILPKINYVNVVSAGTGFREMLKHIDNVQMIHFTKEELEKLTYQGITEEIMKRISNPENVSHLMRARLILSEEMRLDIPNDVFNGCKEAMASLLALEYDIVSCTLLNQLEYFCMCFNCGVADGTIVYQFLHQTFFAVVKMLYYLIAAQNQSAKDKYFTHIIKLYTEWLKRDMENEKKQNEVNNEIVEPYCRISK